MLLVAVEHCCSIAMLNKNWFVSFPLVITIMSSLGSQPSFIKHLFYSTQPHVLGAYFIPSMPYRGKKWWVHGDLKCNLKIIPSSYRWSNYKLLIKFFKPSKLLFSHQCLNIHFCRLAKIIYIWA